MKRTILIIAACLASFGPLRAQESIDEVLLLVEELQAQRKLTEAQKLEAKTGNSLENPSVEFENLWRRPVPGNNSEWTVTQPFDFPGAYAARNKIAKLKASLYDSEGAEFRQQLLLQAKELCIEIIYLRQQQILLDCPTHNASRLYINKNWRPEPPIFWKQTRSVLN